MDKAMNSKKEIINASEANYDNYFCIECGELSYLRKPYDKEPHFYHFRFNENCSLSSESFSDFNLRNRILIENEALLKTNYTERWIEAIDNLIKYNGLFLLFKKEWATKPLCYYLMKMENTNIENALPLLHILFSINYEKTDYIFFIKKFSVNRIIEEKLLKNILYKMNIIPLRFFEFILNNDPYDNETMLWIIQEKMIPLYYDKLIRYGKYINLIIISKLLASKSKGDKLFNEFLSFKKKYFNMMKDEEKKTFYELLIKELKKRDISKYLLDKIEEDYIDSPYYG